MAGEKKLTPFDTNDHWTLDLGRLGMQAAGDRLWRLALQCEPPYAICVQGKWGSGKTSVMRYAMAALGGEPLGLTLSTNPTRLRELTPDLENQWTVTARNSEILAGTLLEPLAVSGQEKTDLRNEIRIVPIWFNAWQHQDSDLPVVALLQEIRAQFSALTKVVDEAKKLSAVAVEAGLNLVGQLIGAFASVRGVPELGSALRSAPPVASTIRNVGEAYEARNFEGLENAQRLSLLFEQAVSRLLDGGSESKPKRALRRLVIFIDDLDRCSEHQTLRLLEAIKLYLQSRNCVFVFGMDMAAARRAVQRGTVAGQAEEAQEYLGKLFQTVLHVPVPRLTEGLTRDLLLYWGLDEASTGVAIEVLARDVAKLVEGNPRKIKNFVNGLAVSWQLLEKHGCKAKFHHFLLMAYLQAYHSDVYRLLVHDPNLLEPFGRALAQSKTFLETDAGAIERFFHRSFRHCFPRLPPEFQPKNRKESDELVDELTHRIDRYSGDSQFLKLWKDETETVEVKALVSSFRPILHGLEFGASGAP